MDADLIKAIVVLKRQVEKLTDERDQARSDYESAVDLINVHLVTAARLRAVPEATPTFAADIAKLVEEYTETIEAADAVIEKDKP